MRLLTLIFHFVLIPHLMGQGALNLVPLSAVTHTAEQDGLWSVASTWGGNLPDDGARVYIPSGVTVTVDGIFNTEIKTVRLDGTLMFRSDVDTELRVETLIGLIQSPYPRSEVTQLHRASQHVWHSSMMGLLICWRSGQTGGGHSHLQVTHEAPKNLPFIHLLQELSREVRKCI